MITRWKALLQHPDRGTAVTSYFVVMVIGIMLFIGLAVDGGAQVQAGVRAERVATEAARAGLQAASPGGDTDPRRSPPPRNGIWPPRTPTAICRAPPRLDGTQLNVTRHRHHQDHLPRPAECQPADRARDRTS